jgi:hypothetical protein
MCGAFGELEYRGYVAVGRLNANIAVPLPDMSRALTIGFAPESARLWGHAL